MNQEQALRDLQARAVRDLFPKMKESAVFLVISPADAEPDVKLCLEIGAAVIMGKPFLVLVDERRRQVLPPKLALIADKILYVRLSDPADASEKIAEALRELGADLG